MADNGAHGWKLWKFFDLPQDYATTTNWISLFGLLKLCDQFFNHKRTRTKTKYE